MLRIIAHDRFHHHGDRSGYDQILRYLDSQAEASLIHLPLPPRGARMLVEWWKAYRASAGATSEIHVYPEQTLFPRRSPRPVVAVCHQPGRRYFRRTLRAALLRRALADCAALVALGPGQALELRALNPVVEVVPHGVDVEWFSPGPAPRGEGPFVVVGGWLRNVGEQAKLVELARSRTRTVIEVGRGGPRLSDRAYRDTLRRSSGVLLWISDGVASNAVLEAASCGKAVVGSLSPDLQWYVSEANRELLRLDPEVQIASPEERFEEVGSENRAYTVARHSWPAVAERLLSVTESACRG